MTINYQGHGVTLHHGDCRDVLAQIPDASVHAVVCDPPYELGFMGKGWDASGIAYDVGVWREVFRVLKPGGHLLAFGGTRTWHRLACAVEDAGFEIRDSIAWLYGSGFPKSLDVSKAIDKAAGAERANLGVDAEAARRNPNGVGGSMRLDGFSTLAELEEAAAAGLACPNGRSAAATLARYHRTVEALHAVTAPATDAARQWEGWGTALKPAHEPVVVARKPLTGTVAANVQQWGTGALNIDACRINPGESIPGGGGFRGGATSRHEGWTRPSHAEGESIAAHTSGRWPANVILDDDTAAHLDEQSGTLTSGKMKPTHTTAERAVFGQNAAGGFTTMETYGDSGGASRFFTVAGYDHRDEDPLEECPDCLDEIAENDRQDAVALGVEMLRGRFIYQAKAPKRERPVVDGVAHPTVKPLTLMRHLVRLVTPPGGTVLEPFAGSGTTVEACIAEGFQCIAIEKGDEYLPLIRERIRRATELPEAAELVRTVDPEQEVAAYIRDSLFNITGEETA